MREESDVLKRQACQALTTCRIALLQGCHWLDKWNWPWTSAQPLCRLLKGTWQILLPPLPSVVFILPLSLLGNLDFSGIDYWHNFPKIQLGLCNHKSLVSEATLLQAILYIGLLFLVLSSPMRVDFYSSAFHPMTSYCCSQAS